MSAAIHLAITPALPLHKAGPYVAAAYIVFVVLLLVYLGIIGLRTTRTERELSSLRAELSGARRAREDEANAPVPEREEEQVV